MRLVVLHYHDRPGGVRSVIARCLPALVRALDGVSEVVFACGEVRDRAWLHELGSSCGTKFTVHINAAFGYTAAFPDEKPAALRMHVRDACRHLLGAAREQTLVWAHNLSVGRNAALAAELTDACAAAGAVLVLHQHDWWFDGRWDRAEEFARVGVRTPGDLCAAFFPAGSHVRTLGINPADAAGVAAVSGRPCRWLPHPCPEIELPPRGEINEARNWLMEWTGGAPVWLYPCRWLARKNVAEALLLARGLAHDAFVLTTGGPSSGGEEDAWEHLRGAADASQWRYRPGVLRTGERAPSPAALMAAADVIVHPSVREGFGLVPVEAALLGRPALVRRPGVARALEPLGISLPWHYDSLPVPRGVVREVPARLSESERGAIQRMDFVERVFGQSPAIPAPDDSPVRDFALLDLWSQIAVLNTPDEELRQIVSQIPPAAPAAAEVPDKYRSFTAECWAAQFVAELIPLPENTAPSGGADALLRWINQQPL